MLDEERIGTAATIFANTILELRKCPGQTFQDYPLGNAVAGHVDVLVILAHPHLSSKPIEVALFDKPFFCQTYNENGVMYKLRTAIDGSETVFEYEAQSDVFHPKVVVSVADTGVISAEVSIAFLAEKRGSFRFSRNGEEIEYYGGGVLKPPKDMHPNILRLIACNEIDTAHEGNIWGSVRALVKEISIAGALASQAASV